MQGKSFIRAVPFKISSLTLLATLLSSPAGHSQLADSPWPMFRHDVRHTGRSPYAGPQTATLAWTYQTGGWVYSSPAIGSDGRVFVGSWDNRENDHE